jgi:putative SOS response-associated peptidase YedK
MCGRYDYFPGEFSDLRIRFNLDQDLPLFKGSFNVAPGQEVPVIIREEGRNKVKLMRWGLVPSWSQDPSIGNRMINARCETLTEKPSFKQLLGTRRCLIPAYGFYEWRREGKSKVPLRIVMKDRQLFTFAGLWDMWRDQEGDGLYTFTIITTNANALLRPIHHRMPVIIDRLGAVPWLDPVVSNPGTLSILLQPFPSELMDTYSNP